MITTSLTINNEQFFTSEGAAAELACTTWAIKKAVDRGHLEPAMRLGNCNLFSREEVDRYRREHRKPRKESREKVAV